METTEATEIIKEIIEECGYSVSAEGNIIMVHIPFEDRPTSGDNQLMAMIKIVEIYVDGPKLSCKCDHISPVNGHQQRNASEVDIDLHEPDSIDKLKALLEIYEEVSRNNTDSNILRIFMHGRHYYL